MQSSMYNIAELDVAGCNSLGMYVGTYIKTMVHTWNVLQCSMLQCGMLQCGMLQCGMLECSMLQCVVDGA